MYEADLVRVLIEEVAAQATEKGRAERGADDSRQELRILRETTERMAKGLSEADANSKAWQQEAETLQHRNVELSDRLQEADITNQRHRDVTANALSILCGVTNDLIEKSQLPGRRKIPEHLIDSAMSAVENAKIALKDWTPF